MGSVFVTWSGGCADAAARDRLAARLSDLGDRWHGHFPAPPARMRRTRETHSGCILVERAVFAPQSDLSALPTAVEAQPSNAPFKLGNPLVPETKDVEDDLLAVAEVVLDGIAFRLYDGRGLYADDVVSFVFANFPGRPELGHRLVKVEDRASFDESADPAIADADLYLGRPRIHLRTYCEDWMDWLLAAVKIFYVKDLESWRYEPQPNFETIAAQVAALDPATAEATVFAYLAQRLDAEVESWRERASQASAFWAMARGTTSDEPG